jgi:hypothetical protein
MLCIHLRLGLPSGLFLSGYPTNLTWIECVSKHSSVNVLQPVVNTSRIILQQECANSGHNYITAGFIDVHVDVRLFNVISDQVAIYVTSLRA